MALQWPKQEQETLYAASDRVLSSSGCSIIQALLELNVLPKDLPRLHAEVDRYTRGKDRVSLIKGLQGHKVHIWGDGPWQTYLPDCHIHPPIPFDQTIERMRESKVVLNSAPRFKAGSHERIFYALMCGASVYTGETSYLKHELPELFTYRFGEWQPPSFDQWQERALQGQQTVLANHTWDKRASQLLSMPALQAEAIAYRVLE